MGWGASKGPRSAVTEGVGGGGQVKSTHYPRTPYRTLTTVTVGTVGKLFISDLIMLLNRSSVFVESFPRFVGTGGGVLGRSVSICPSNTIRSFTNQTSKTFIDRLSPTLPEIESSLRFSGRWERFKGVGNPCFPYTRNDLLVECKGRWSEGKSDITTMLQTMKVFEVDLSIEKRGRLPFSQTKYLPKLERDLGNELEILKMTIDSENVLKILQFDGEKKEILQIEQEDENGIVSTGFIGMEKG